MLNFGFGRENFVQNFQENQQNMVTRSTSRPVSRSLPYLSSSQNPTMIYQTLFTYLTQFLRTALAEMSNQSSMLIQQATTPASNTLPDFPFVFQPQGTQSLVAPESVGTLPLHPENVFIPPSGPPQNAVELPDVILNEPEGELVPGEQTPLESGTYTSLDNGNVVQIRYETDGTEPVPAHVEEPQPVVEPTPLSSTELNETFVQELYHTILERDGEPEGVAHWVNALEQDGLSEREAVKAFFNSQEFRTRFGDAPMEQTVTKLYNLILNREPEPEGLSHWVNHMNQTGDINGTIDGFFDSAEFQSKSVTLRQQIQAEHMAQPVETVALSRSATVQAAVDLPTQQESAVTINNQGVLTVDGLEHQSINDNAVIVYEEGANQTTGNVSVYVINNGSIEHYSTMLMANETPDEVLDRVSDAALEMNPEFKLGLNQSAESAAYIDAYQKIINHFDTYDTEGDSKDYLSNQELHAYLTDAVTQGDIDVAVANDVLKHHHEMIFASIQGPSRAWFGTSKTDLDGNIDNSDPNKEDVYGWGEGLIQRLQNLQAGETLADIGEDLRQEVLNHGGYGISAAQAADTEAFRAYVNQSARNSGATVDKFPLLTVDGTTPTDPGASSPQLVIDTLNTYKDQLYTDGHLTLTNLQNVINNEPGLSQDQKDILQRFADNYNRLTYDDRIQFTLFQERNIGQVGRLYSDAAFDQLEPPEFPNFIKASVYTEALESLGDDIYNPSSIQNRINQTNDPVFKSVFQTLSNHWNNLINERYIGGLMPHPLYFSETAESYINNNIELLGGQTGVINLDMVSDDIRSMNHLSISQTDFEALLSYEDPENPGTFLKLSPFDASQVVEANTQDEPWSEYLPAKYENLTAEEYQILYSYAVSGETLNSGNALNTLIHPLFRSDALYDDLMSQYVDETFALSDLAELPHGAGNDDIVASDLISALSTVDGANGTQADGSITQAELVALANDPNTTLTLEEHIAVQQLNQVMPSIGSSHPITQTNSYTDYINQNATGTPATFNSGEMVNQAHGDFIDLVANTLGSLDTDASRFVTYEELENFTTSGNPDVDILINSMKENYTRLHNFRDTNIVTPSYDHYQSFVEHNYIHSLYKLDEIEDYVGELAIEDNGSLNPYFPNQLTTPTDNLLPQAPQDFPLGAPGMDEDPSDRLALERDLFNRLAQETNLQSPDAEKLRKLEKGVLDIANLSSVQIETLLVEVDMDQIWFNGSTQPSGHLGFSESSGDMVEVSPNNYEIDLNGRGARIFMDGLAGVDGEWVDGKGEYTLTYNWNGKITTLKFINPGAIHYWHEFDHGFDTPSGDHEVIQSSLIFDPDSNGTRMMMQRTSSWDNEGNGLTNGFVEEIYQLPLEFPQGAATFVRHHYDRDGNPIQDGEVFDLINTPFGEDPQVYLAEKLLDRREGFNNTDGANVFLNNTFMNLTVAPVIYNENGDMTIDRVNSVDPSDTYRINIQSGRPYTAEVYDRLKYMSGGSVSADYMAEIMYDMLGVDETILADPNHPEFAAELEKFTEHPDRDEMYSALMSVAPQFSGISHTEIESAISDVIGNVGASAFEHIVNDPVKSDEPLLNRLTEFYDAFYKYPSDVEKAYLNGNPQDAGAGLVYYFTQAQQISELLDNPDAVEELADQLGTSAGVIQSALSSPNPAQLTGDSRRVFDTVMFNTSLLTHHMMAQASPMSEIFNRTSSDYAQTRIRLSEANEQIQAETSWFDEMSYSAISAVAPWLPSINDIDPSIDGTQAETFLNGWEAKLQVMRAARDAGDLETVLTLSEELYGDGDTAGDIVTGLESIGASSESIVTYSSIMGDVTKGVLAGTLAAALVPFTGGFSAATVLASVAAGAATEAGIQVLDNGLSGDGLFNEVGGSMLSGGLYGGFTPVGRVIGLGSKAKFLKYAGRLGTSSLAQTVSKGAATTGSIITENAVANGVPAFIETLPQGLDEALYAAGFGTVLGAGTDGTAEFLSGLRLLTNNAYKHPVHPEFDFEYYPNTAFSDIIGSSSSIHSPRPPQGHDWDGIRKLNAVIHELGPKNPKNVIFDVPWDSSFGLKDGGNFTPVSSGQWNQFTDYLNNTFNLVDNPLDAYVYLKNNFNIAVLAGSNGKVTVDKRTLDFSDMGERDIVSFIKDKFAAEKENPGKFVPAWDAPSLTISVYDLPATKPSFLSDAEWEYAQKEVRNTMLEELLHMGQSVRSGGEGGSQLRTLNTGTESLMDKQDIFDNSEYGGYQIWQREWDIYVLFRLAGLEIDTTFMDGIIYNRELAQQLWDEVF